MGHVRNNYLSNFSLPHDKRIYLISIHCLHSLSHVLQWPYPDGDVPLADDHPHVDHWYVLPPHICKRKR